MPKVTPTQKIHVHPKDQGFRAEVERLSENQCSVERLAYYFNLTPDVFRRWMDQEPELAFARERGLANGQRKLLETQFEVAIQDKNVPMLIWLGKQILGQKEPDKNLKLSGDKDAPVQVANYTEMIKEAVALEKAVDEGVPRKKFAAPAKLATKQLPEKADAE